MYRNKTIALVIPAYNEERLIQPTLKEVPECVDKVYVVDDLSTDNMAAVVRTIAKQDQRIQLIQHQHNIGPGQSIITGYGAASADGYEVVVVVGGDYQMPYNEIEQIMDPVIDGEADYAKGNRFLHWDKTKAKMPKLRIFANLLITAITKFASGYFKIMDVVDGYTAISKDAIDRVNWDKAWKKYGYPMDFLIQLNTYGLRVKDVPRTPVYIEGERQSQIKGFSYALKVTPMLIRGFFRRLVYKYLYLNFHPLVFFYFLGITLLPLGVVLGLNLVYAEFFGNGVSGPTATLCALMVITGLHSLIFAMWFDMEVSS
jgi:glycosyltransferase involved in cell wall biosynthesis